MTSQLDTTSEGGGHASQAELEQGHGVGRSADRRGQRDRCRDPDRQLEPGLHSGLAGPGHHRGDHCEPLRALPASPGPRPGGERGPCGGMKNLVRTLRMSKNLAQGELAEAMGVSRQTINSIEKERYTPSLPLAMALARYFGVTVEEMFDDQA